MTPNLRSSNSISRKAAINRVRRWFSAQPEADYLSVEDIFQISGRGNFNEKTNRRWLSDNLSVLKPYDLVKPVYDEGKHGRKLLRIHLTPEGKRALAETETAERELAEARLTRATLNEEMRTSPMGATMTSDLPASKYISRSTAIDKVRQWFSAQPEADSVSVKDIFKLSGRESLSGKRNRKWLSNLLYSLKPYYLIKPVYDEGKPGRKLLRIHLTPEGKRALAETELTEAKLTGAILSGEGGASTAGAALTSEPRPSKYVSRPTAINRLRRLFSTQPDADSLSVEEIFQISGRENRTEQANRKWLSFTLLVLKPYSLVKPIYGLGAPGRKILRIQLTPEGKRALAGTEPDETTVTETAAPFHIGDQEITVNDAMDIVARFQSENPDLKVTFEIRLKQHEKS